MKINRVVATVLTSCWLSLLFASQTSHALTVDGLVFGPATFERADGDPYVEEAGFEAADPEGNFFLIVETATPDEGQELSLNVSSALISVNGDQLLSPGDFSKKRHRMEVPVTLAEVNRVEVEMRGKPGSWLKLSVVERFECPDTGCAPYSVRPVLETLNAVTATIGPDGGEIFAFANNGTQHTLIFPEGAIGVPTAITLTPVGRVEGLPLLGGLVSAVQFEPKGLILAKAAMLTMDFPFDLDRQAAVAFGWGGNADEFYIDPQRPADRHLAMTIAHFSGAGVAMGDIEAGAASVEGASLLDFVVRTRIAREDERIQQALCPDGDCDDAEYEAYLESFISMLHLVFEQYALDVEFLVSTAGESSLRWALAMREVQAFNALLQEWFGLDRDEFYQGLEKQSLAWIESLTESAVAVFEQLGQPVCDDPEIRLLTNDLAYLDLAGRVAAKAGVEGLFGLESKYGCRLVVTVDDFPNEISEDAGAVPFTVTLRYRPTGEPIPHLGVSIGRESDETSCAQIDGARSAGYFSDENGAVRTQLAVGNCGGKSARVVISVADSSQAVSADSADSMFWTSKMLLLEAAVVDEEPGPRILPEQFSIEIGESIQFLADFPGVENPIIEWSATGGIIDADGTYTAGPLPGDFQVTLTVYVDDSKYEVIRSFSIDGTAIEISPADVVLAPGESVQFSAFVAGPDDTSVTWSASGGVITAGGLFTAPAGSGEFFVTATSNADPAVVAVASATVASIADIDLSGWYVGEVLEDWDYGEDHGGGFALEGSVYHWSEDDGSGAQQQYLQLFRFNSIGTFNATLDGDTFSGFSTNDSSSCLVDGIPSCPITGTIAVTDDTVVITAKAVNSLKCDCYKVIEVRRQN